MKVFIKALINHYFQNNVAEGVALESESSSEMDHSKHRTSKPESPLNPDKYWEDIMSRYGNYRAEMMAARVDKIAQLKSRSGDKIEDLENVVTELRKLVDEADHFLGWAVAEKEKAKKDLRDAEAKNGSQEKAKQEQETKVSQARVDEAAKYKQEQEMTARKARADEAAKYKHKDQPRTAREHEKAPPAKAPANHARTTEHGKAGGAQGRQDHHKDHGTHESCETSPRGLHFNRRDDGTPKDATDRVKEAKQAFQNARDLASEVRKF